MKRELITSACIMAICILLYQEAAKLPPPRFEILGPALFPKFILSAIMGLTVIHMFITVLQHCRGKVVAVPGDNSPKPSSTFIGVALPIIVVFYFVAYALLISYSPAPYMALTFFYIMLTSWTLSLFSRQSILPSALTAFGVTIFIYLVFVYGLELMLP